MPISHELDAVDHVALSVTDIREALDWYHRHFQCDVLYQDDTWALVQFSNHCCPAKGGNADRK